MTIKNTIRGAIAVACLTLGVSAANAAPALLNDPTPASTGVSTPVAQNSYGSNRDQFKNGMRYRYGNGNRHRRYNNGNVGLGIAGLIIGGIISESIRNRDDDATYVRCTRRNGAWYRGHARGFAARWCRVY